MSYTRNISSSTLHPLHHEIFASKQKTIVFFKKMMVRRKKMMAFLKNMMVFEVKRHHVFKKRLGISKYHPDFLKGEGGEGLKRVYFMGCPLFYSSNQPLIMLMASCFISSGKVLMRAL